MKLLVLGGNGHYAGLISQHLAAKHEVTVFDLNGDPCDFAHRQLVGSILEPESLVQAAVGAEAIVCFFVGNAELSTAGMVNVMTAAEQAGIGHVVYTSSGGMPFPVAAYSEGHPQFSIGDFSADFWRGYFPITEDAGLFPGNENESYFLHKWLCEQIGRRFAKRGKVKFSAIRPGLLMHDDMSNRATGETERNYNPFFMLVTGQVRMVDAAHLFDLALQNPPESFAAYHLSNDTPYNNLSIEKAQRRLGYACVDQRPYMDFYQSERMDWPAAFAELVEKGFPADLLRGLYGFRHL